MLKNMFYTLIGATFFLTIIWVAVGYDKYGSDLIYHHLNLKAMVLKVRDEWYGYNIYDDIKNLRNITYICRQDNNNLITGFKECHKA